MKRIVFDLDDTLSVHKNRDYANAEPVTPVIGRMQELRASMPEVQIVILTARGMASCNGDVKLAEAKNRPVLEKWLAQHNVPYDEIIFGKPLGDAYVDDKAVSVEEFARLGCARMTGGFSGKPVSRVGSIVVKRCDNEELLAAWFKEAERHDFGWCKFPHLISHQLGKVYLRYAEGRPMCELTASEIHGQWLTNVALAVRSFSRVNLGDNDLNAYGNYVAERCQLCGVSPSQYVNAVYACKDVLGQRTFHHGDFSTMNLICEDGGWFTAIDPNPKGDVQCHLIDAAKFYASLCGLERVLTGKDDKDKGLLGNPFLLHFDEKEQKAIRALAATLVIRVAAVAAKRGDRKRVGQLLEIPL